VSCSCISKHLGAVTILLSEHASVRVFTRCTACKYRMGGTYLRSQVKNLDDIKCSTDIRTEVGNETWADLIQEQKDWFGQGSGNALILGKQSPVVLIPYPDISVLRWLAVEEFLNKPTDELLSTYKLTDKKWWQVWK
jgi:hypothetical protein